MSRPQTEIAQEALAAKQTDDADLWEGPAFSKESARKYLDLTSIRGVDKLEELGLLKFQRIGKRSVRTTKSRCDRLLRLGIQGLLGNGEADPT